MFPGSLSLRYADSAYVVADSLGQLQKKCRALVLVAAEYDIPLSASSVEVLAAGDVECSITLENGNTFAQTATLKVLGVQVDSGGSTRTAKEKASVVWFRNREWSSCRHVPLIPRANRDVDELPNPRGTLAACHDPLCAHRWQALAGVVPGGDPCRLRNCSPATGPGPRQLAPGPDGFPSRCRQAVGGQPLAACLGGCQASLLSLTLALVPLRASFSVYADARSPRMGCVGVGRACVPSPTNNVLVVQSSWFHPCRVWQRLRVIQGLIWGVCIAKAHRFRVGVAWANAQPRLALRAVRRIKCAIRRPRHQRRRVSRRSPRLRPARTPQISQTTPRSPPRSRPR